MVTSLFCLLSRVYCFRVYPRRIGSLNRISSRKHMALPSSRATLVVHDLVSDPGGDLNTCHSALRFAAFRSINNVGFHSAFAELILTDHNYTFFGAQYRPYTLIPSGFGLHYWFYPQTSLLPCWLSFRQVGIDTLYFLDASPTG